MKHILFFLSFGLWTAYSKTPDPGFWIGYFSRPDGVEMPFYFQFTQKPRQIPVIRLINGTEAIEAEHVIMNDDTMVCQLAYFDTELRMQLQPDGSMSGIWRDNSRENMVLPFRAAPADYTIQHDFYMDDNTWAAIFRPGAPNAYPAIITTEYKNGMMHTTVRAPSGDFRYLNTLLKNDTLLLFKFDGIVIYYLCAIIKGDSLVNGKMYSGPNYTVDWHAVKDPAAALPDAYERTKVVNSKPLEIKLRDINGDSVLLTRKDFIGKITLLPIMGTWCPNCLDETRHIATYMEQHPEMPIQVFGLCFERPKEWDKISLLLHKYTRSLKLPFPLFYAGYADAPSASAVFPILDGIKAFPTLLVLDKSGQIRQVITGFDGPATGKAYADHAARFDALMQTLSAE